MAKCCVDTNILIAAAKILHYRVLDQKIETIETGKSNSLYPIIREISGLSGKSLCTVKSVVDEIDRGINPNAIGGSQRVQQLRLRFGYLYPLIKDLIESKFQVFSVTQETHNDIKSKKSDLFDFTIPNSSIKKNIYTDYRQYRECIENGIYCILSRNLKDFEYCYAFEETQLQLKRLSDPEFDPENKIRVRKLKVIVPPDPFFQEAHESYTPIFTNSMAGRLLESLYRNKYLTRYI